MNAFDLTRDRDCWRGSFTAMASPCEILLEADEESLAKNVCAAITDEAKRIEHKFSRYRTDNNVFAINDAGGRPVVVDDETARLIEFAVELYDMSEGMFDITSGVLREAWSFDGSDKLPEATTVEQIRANVGWDKVRWQDHTLQMRPGMEIDFGGIGKEYAVDSCVQIAREMTDESVLINFGGDLATTCSRRDDKVWSVGRLITGNDHAVSLFRLRHGAIATSGDAYRFLLKDGVRYSHVLDPKTGWPVPDAPHTVSVAAATCLEAGMLSTLAMLHGSNARSFLELQEVDFWID